MTSKEDAHKGWTKCEGCGKPFRFWRGSPRFCSQYCRVKAWREARKG